MRVLIRADASPTIGSGHIARCVTLARALRAKGSHVAFACRRLCGHRLDVLQAQGFETFALPERYYGEDPDQAIEAMLPWQADIDALALMLEGRERFDWIIVDHHGLDHYWQTAARRWAPRIAAVDDLATRRYDVDLLLNQNLSGLSENYAPLVPVGCRVLLGPHYAMLRAVFNCPAIEIKPHARRVLVNFGGFDAAMQTYQVMLALADSTELEVDFVAGAVNPAWAQMQAMVEARPNWRLNRFVSDFYQRMTEADLFIGAGGGTCWERAALGLPTICIAVSNNQQANGEAMAVTGGHVFMGSHDRVSVDQLRQAVNFVISNHYLRQCLAGRSRQLVDGRGAYRVASALAEPLLRCRAAPENA
ncbi:UDP-2,4-diacetamido-2,4,6-trideoxy-beta-L-altropyranose hydrolase [Pseudomonas syringae]|nr:UDP-2,4-diacetamido-2,4,6-trideoxy-beta-L-altropyranose hydrolase [Pseudomonas syringae]